MERVVGAGLGRDGAAVEQHPTGGDRLVEPVEPLAEAGPEVDAVRRVLELEPGATDAQDGPAIADVVERGRELGGQARVPERVGADQQPELHPLGGHRPCRQQRPALEDGLVRVTEDGVEVVPGPEAVVAQALDLTGAGELLLHRRALRPEQGAQLQVRHRVLQGSVRAASARSLSGRACPRTHRLGLTMPRPGHAGWLVIDFEARGDAWSRQGRIPGEREPRLSLGLVNQATKRSNWQPPACSRPRCLRQ